jgi:hypothetical protein
MFEHIAAELQREVPIFNLTITAEQYQAWQQHYLFEAVKGRPYGQSFCEYFEIIDYILMFSNSTEADSYIKRTYIK